MVDGLLRGGNEMAEVYHRDGKSFAVYWITFKLDNGREFNIRPENVFSFQQTSHDATRTLIQLTNGKTVVANIASSRLRDILMGKD